jgi:glycosyltransferase involved in cell wall biosynthesis
MNALFTVGIPVTKTKHLSKALASVLEQSRNDWELLVVDNKADKPVVEFIPQDIRNRCRLITRQERLSPVDNWNNLLEEVRTQWFILLSDDDYLEPDHLQQLSSLVERFPRVDVFHTRVRMVDENDRALGLSPLAPDWETMSDLVWHRCAGMRQQFLSDFMWRTSALREQGGFANLPAAWGTDDLTAARLSARAGIAFGARPTLNYRIHSGSITGKVSPFPKIYAIQRLVEEYSGLLGKAAQETSRDDAQVAGLALARLESYRITASRDLLSAAPPLFALKALFTPSLRLRWRSCLVAMIRSLRTK